MKIVPDEMTSSVMFEADSEANVVHQEDAIKTSKTTSIVTSILRASGCLLIVFAAMSFMLQGAQGVQPVYRYWLALVMVLLVSGGGLICAYVFKENKGARSFFALGSAFLAVQVSQISAMLHSYFIAPNQQQSAAYLSWWQTVDVSFGMILLNVVVTVLLFVPIVYSAFSVLARQQRKQLVVAYAVANLGLLLPFRDVYIIPLLIAALLYYLRHVNQHMSGVGAMQVFEGIVARVILWVPVLIIIGRSALYPVSFLLPLVLLVFLALIFLLDVKKSTQNAFFVCCAEFLGMLCVALAWGCVASQLQPQVDFGILVMLGGMLMFVISTLLHNYARIYRALSALLITFALFDVQVSELLVSLLGLTSGIMLLAVGVYYREKLPMLAGLMCFGKGVLYYLNYLTLFYESSPWLSIIALGLAVMLLASYIEKKDAKIKQTTKYYLAEFSSWH